MHSVSLQIRQSDGDVREQKDIPLENALRALLTHDWRSELARASREKEPEDGPLILAVVTNSSNDDLLVYPEIDGTFSVVYLRSPVRGVPVPEGKNRPRRMRDELSLNSLAEIVTRFAADDREWLVATTASFGRCVAALVSLSTLIVTFILGGSWALASLLNLDPDKNLSLPALLGWAAWFCLMIVLASGLWLAIGRSVFTRTEALFGWRVDWRFDRWIFDKVFPETLSLGGDTRSSR